MNRYLVFGDSITWGSLDEEGGWVERLKTYLLKDAITKNLGDYHSVYNLGIAGDDSVGLLKRFENEIKARKTDDDPLVIVIAIGINDSQIMKVTGQHKVQLYQYKQNLKLLITQARRYSTNVICVGLTPVDDALSDTPEFSYKNTVVSQFNDILQQTASEENAGFIEVFSVFPQGDYKKLLADGLHPNAEGHKKIFELVRQYIKL